MVERLLPPTFPQLGLGDADGLCLTGGERGDSGAVAGVDASPIHLSNNLRPSSGERLAHVGADTDDLGNAVTVNLIEHDS